MGHIPAAFQDFTVEWNQLIFAVSTACGKIEEGTDLSPVAPVPVDGIISTAAKEQRRHLLSYSQLPVPSSSSWPPASQIFLLNF